MLGIRLYGDDWNELANDFNQRYRPTIIQRKRNGKYWNLDLNKRIDDARDYLRRQMQTMW
jgi:hypothetical protein